MDTLFNITQYTLLIFGYIFLLFLGISVILSLYMGLDLFIQYINRECIIHKKFLHRKKPLKKTHKKLNE